MPRPALLVALALTLVGGCRTAADAEQVGSPGGSVAGTETSPAAGPATLRPPSLRSSEGPSSPLVAVAAINPADAQPCEQVCGRLGDCLLADEDYTELVAGGLELECLDLCVHSPDGERVKDEFLACGATAECGPLQACAERNWEGLASLHNRPELAGIVAAVDPCKSGCRWFYACVTTGLPPGEAYLDPNMETAMNECMTACDSLPAGERDRFAKLASCLPNRCGSDPFACWDYN